MTKSDFWESEKLGQTKHPTIRKAAIGTPSSKRSGGRPHRHQSQQHPKATVSASATRPSAKNQRIIEPEHARKDLNILKKNHGKH